MKSNKFWAAAGRVLAAATVMIIVTLMLAPGAWAANTYKILYSFTGGTDGGGSDAGLILDAAGNLYGTTSGGGAYGFGTVFQMTPNSGGTWTETVLYSFAGGSDGANPYAGVIFDDGGNLYGTTMYGGNYGYGTVYELALNSGTWTESVLYTFTGGKDGAIPGGDVILDATGNLYGETNNGGVLGRGVVFQLTPNSGGSWTERVLHSFVGGSKDGSNPRYASLIFDAAGNLYGTTADKGVRCSYGGDWGTVFELMPSQDGKWKEKLLHHFLGRKSGCRPTGTLIFDQYGSLYGVASGGYVNTGNVFKLKLGANGKWNEQVLYRFAGGDDGAYPQGGVVFDTAGNLYGTTAAGQPAGQVFELIPDSQGRWTKQVLHYFQGGTDGANPAAGVVFDTTGNLYGTTANGGSSGASIVFEISP